MTRTWRNEPRSYAALRTAGRWIVWAACMFIAAHVLATVVQRMTEG
jgi:hypothetical protein